MNRKHLYADWLESQAAKSSKRRRHSKPFIGERGYPHLDNKLFYPKVGNNQEQAAMLEELVTNPEKIKKNPFLPFIRNDKRQRKYRQPPNDYDFSSIRGDRDQTKFPHIKSRPIMYAGHRDACIFSFFSYQIEQLYEVELAKRKIGENVIAYRSIDGKNNIDFAKLAFDELTRRNEYECMMLDVKSFFDTIDHKLLKENWDNLLPGGFKHNADHMTIFERITQYRFLILNEAAIKLRTARVRYEYRDNGCFKLCRLDDYNKYLKKIVKKNRSNIGIPQGSPISGVLANIYLLDFDEHMKKIIVDEKDGLYQRYSDDIMVICPVGDAQPIYESIKASLANRKLRLGEKKTEAFRKEKTVPNITNITSELEPSGSYGREVAQYLGFHFDGKHIVLRPSTVAKHIRKRSKANYMKSAYQKTKDKRLARQVNKVRGVMKRK